MLDTISIFSMIKRSNSFLIIVPLVYSNPVHQSFTPLSHILAMRGYVCPFTMNHILIELTLIRFLLAESDPSLPVH